MAQKYRIYINEKVILLTGKEPKRVADYKQIDSEDFDLRMLYTWVLNHPNKFFYVLCNDVKAFFKTAKKSVTLIEAAGGLVKNEDGEYLFIFRNNKWDLPKGKIEKHSIRKNICRYNYVFVLTNVRTKNILRL